MKRIKNTVTFKLTAKENKLLDRLSDEEPDAFYEVDLFNVNWDEPFVTLTWYDIDDLQKFDYEMQKLIREASKYDKRIASCKVGLSPTMDTERCEVIRHKLEEAGFDVMFIEDVVYTFGRNV